MRLIRQSYIVLIPSIFAAALILGLLFFGKVFESIKNIIFVSSENCSCYFDFMFFVFF